MLAFALLAVSLLSLAAQSFILIRVMASNGAWRVKRTVSCRVIAALAYVGVAFVALSGAEHVDGLSLWVFTGVQALWISNSIADWRN